jgi:2-amino-4-hydroxy-6-hydroxymethyldihydropteridine diphosphokinase
VATIYIALGTNIGDREKNLRDAQRLLGGLGVQIRKVSGIYETEPVDYLDQPWFLNTVLEAETSMPAEELLNTLRGIESQMGSKKAFAKGPRLIDLDILLYDGATIETASLQVPHPRMLLRNFVMVPLAEIAPHLKHPSWTAPVSELLKKTSDASQVRKYK